MLIFLHQRFPIYRLSRWLFDNETRFKNTQWSNQNWGGVINMENCRVGPSNAVCICKGCLVLLWGEFWYLQSLLAQSKTAQIATATSLLPTPNICQFWYSTAIFRPLKSASIHNKKRSQNGPKFCLFYVKKYNGLEKYTSLGSGGSDQYLLCFYP